MRPVNPVDHLTLDEKDYFFLKRKKHKTRQDKTRKMYRYASGKDTFKDCDWEFKNG